MRTLTRADFKVPVLLILLSLVPTLGGIARVMSVANDTTVTEDNARFLHAPTPIVIHVIAATLYCLLGAFQFSKGLRVRWPGLHRRAGRVLAVCGLLAGLTGLWMTLLYTIPTPMQGPLTYWVRLLVGSAMVASIVIAWRAILRRQVARHEAWMIRAYALGQGAGTQALILGPWMLITGDSVGLTRDLLLTLSWLINAAVAERIIAARAKPAAARSVAPRDVHRELPLAS